MLYAQTNFVAVVQVSLVRYNETRRDVLYLGIVELCAKILQIMRNDFKD